MDEVKRKEALKNSSGNINIFQQIKVLQQQLSMLTIREIEIKLNYVKLNLQINQGNGWLMNCEKKEKIK